jgi:hypothetical protein
MTGEHDVRLAFHLSEICSVVAVEGTTVVVDADGRRIRFALDAALGVAVLRGSLSPRAGWISRGYHHRAPICTIAGTARLRGPQRLLTRISFGD